MSWWNELVIDNPMLIEIKRFMRRFLGNNSSTNMVAASITLILLSVIYMLVYINELLYQGTAVLALVTLCLLIPIMLHGAIAGERERRSWDMLLVAPVTNAQIIAGKFIGASGGIAVVLIAFSVAQFLSDYPLNDRFATGAAVMLIIAAFAYCVAAFTLFISARSKRSMSALGITYGCLFLALAVFPAVASFASISTMDDIESVFYLHPVYAVIEVNQKYFPSHDVMSAYAQEKVQRNFALFGLPHVLVYLGAACVFLGLAINSLNSAGWEDPTLNRKE